MLLELTQNFHLILRIGFPNRCQMCAHSINTERKLLSINTDDAIIAHKLCHL